MGVAWKSESSRGRLGAAANSSAKEQNSKVQQTEGQVLALVGGGKQGHHHLLPSLEHWP